MKEGGAVLGALRDELMEAARPGVTLADLEMLAQARIREAGMKPSFSTVANYQWATCLCVNDVIVHGIPTNYALKEGDLFTADVGLIHGGYHSDTAWSKIICADPETYQEPEAVRTFLDIGQLALVEAIAVAKVGNRVGHISQTIQRIVEGAGYGIAKSLVGHGIGRELHEPPQIPGFLKGPVEKTQPLVEGMTVAIEVIYTMGKPTLAYHEDGWSIMTKDHSLSAVFERSVAILADGPLVLTK